MIERLGITVLVDNTAGGRGLLSEYRIHATLECLKRYDVQLLGANHCTGLTTMGALWHKLGDRCVDCRTCTQVVIVWQAD